jgi:NAD(P)H-dependent FMN reductase
MGKIIAFSGSNSSTSINQKLVHATVALFEKSEVEVLDLRDFVAPLFSADLVPDSIPQSMRDLSAKMIGADGFLVSSPEHNGSMPAVLKNTIDWLSMIEKKPFLEKPTVFLSTSPGPRGGISALDHLVAIMPYRGAKIVGHYALGSFSEHYTDGVLDAESLEAIKSEIRKLEEAI